jgi:hypothetical protein
LYRKFLLPEPFDKEQQMNENNTSSIAVLIRSAIRWIMAVGLMLQILFLLPGGSLATTRWTPSVNLAAMYDDNVLFDQTDMKDDYVYTIQPQIKVEHAQELTRIASEGSVIFRRFQDNDDLNDEIYSFNLDAGTNLSERFRTEGYYRLIKDTTLESELKETGRLFQRDDRMSHTVGLYPSLNLTERTNIGIDGSYRDVAYDSDTFVDYTAWDISLPVRRTLTSQLDIIYIRPGYSDNDSDTTHSKSYYLKLGWIRQATERLNLDVSVGPRYTELEELDTGETDKSWNGVAKLKLGYKFETGHLNIDFQRNLESTASGQQADVSRLIALLNWNFSERIGMELNGSYYYTKTEGKNTDETTEYLQGGVLFLYELTENHHFFIAYDYSHDRLKDSNEPTSSSERNQVWTGVRLNFPIG